MLLQLELSRICALRHAASLCLKQAGSAGHQPALLMSAFNFRLRRTNEQLSAKARYVAASWESNYFKQATECNEENMSRDMLPWKSELCAQAAVELDNALAAETATATEYSRIRRESKVSSEPNWGLIAVAGLVALFAASVAADASGGMSAAEQLQYEQSQVNKRIESNWANVGAAMFLP